MENKLEIGGNTIIGIENGSNTNGNYTKFSDGTMIQWGVASLGTCAINTFLDGTITFPISFSNTVYGFSPIIRGTVISGNMQGTFIIKNAYEGSVEIRYLSNATYTVNVTVTWMALGRWK